MENMKLQIKYQLVLPQKSGARNKSIHIKHVARSKKKNTRITFETSEMKMKERLEHCEIEKERGERKFDDDNQLSLRE